MPSSDHTQYRLSKCGGSCKIRSGNFQSTHNDMSRSQNCELFVHIQLGARSCTVYQAFINSCFCMSCTVYQGFINFCFCTLTILNHKYISLYVSGHIEFVHAMSDLSTTSTDHTFSSIQQPLPSSHSLMYCTSPTYRNTSETDGSTCVSLSLAL